MKIAAFGSCRIQSAVSLACAGVGFDNPIRSYGLVHSTAEIIQQIRWMMGEREIPEPIWPFVSEQSFLPCQKNEFQPDAVIAEISSINCILYGEYSLQLNRLSSALAEFPELWQIWRKYPRTNQLEQRHALLNEQPSFMKINELTRSILQNAVMKTQTVEEIQADLTTIRTFTSSPLLVVTHFSTGDVPAMRSRNKAIGEVIRACSIENLPFFNPSDDLISFGVETGLANSGEDNHHYTNEFAERVGKKIINMLHSTLSNSGKISEMPLSDKQLFLMTLNKRFTGSADQAMSLVIQVKKHAPDTLWAWKAIASANVVVNNREIALECWENINRLAPENGSLWFEAANVAIHFEDYIRADRLLERAGECGVLNDLDRLMMAKIYAAAGRIDDALSAMCEYMAENKEEITKIAYRPSEGNWVRALACRASAMVRGPIDIDQARTEIFDSAVNAAIVAARAEDFKVEADNLRLAQFISVGDDDLIMRSEGVRMAAIQSATAFSRRNLNTGRLAELLAIGEVPNDLAMEASAYLSQSGYHKQAATQLMKNTPDTWSERTASTVRQWFSSALEKNDLDAAHRYFEVLEKYAANDNSTNKFRASLLKREVRKMRLLIAENSSYCAVLASARAVLTLDSRNIQALRIAAFAPDLKPADQYDLLCRLLTERSTFSNLARKNLHGAIKAGNYGTACIYYSVLAGSKTLPREDMAQLREKLLKHMLKAMKACLPDAIERAMVLADRILELEPNRTEALTLKNRASAHASGMNETQKSLTSISNMGGEDADLISDVEILEMASA